MNRFLACLFCLLLLQAAAVTGCGNDIALPEPGIEDIPAGEVREPEPEGASYRNLEYARAPAGGEEKPLLLDLYLPGGESGPYPLVIYIHGGGWLEGDKETHLGPHLTGHGFALASVNYRLSHEAVFPAQIHDVKAAVRWLRANAAEYNLDPERFGVWGHSAGGHLAALLGASGGVAALEGEDGCREFSSTVQAVCDFSGPTDFTAVQAPFPAAEAYPPFSGEFFERYGGEPWFEYSLATAALLGGPPSELRELASLANPIAHLDRSDPPFLVVHGADDDIVPPEQSDLLVETLQRLGVPVEYLRLEQKGHHLGSSYGETVMPELMERVVLFFNTHLKG